jgi:hypothetical protein
VGVNNLISLSSMQLFKILDKYSCSRLHRFACCRAPKRSLKKIHVSTAKIEEHRGRSLFINQRLLTSFFAPLLRGAIRMYLRISPTPPLMACDVQGSRCAYKQALPRLQCGEIRPVRTTSVKNPFAHHTNL